MVQSPNYPTKCFHCKPTEPESHSFCCCRLRNAAAANSEKKSSCNTFLMFPEVFIIPVVMFRCVQHKDMELTEPGASEKTRETWICITQIQKIQKSPLPSESRSVNTGHESQRTNKHSSCFQFVQFFYFPLSGTFRRHFENKGQGARGSYLFSCGCFPGCSASDSSLCDC